VGCDLAAELTADGSAATGDEDSFSIYKGKNLFHVRLHRLTSQKILDRDVLHGGDFDLAQDQLVHAGEVFQFTVGLLADGQDIAALAAAAGIAAVVFDASQTASTLLGAALEGLTSASICQAARQSFIGGTP
jgi:hypothetical protein